MSTWRASAPDEVVRFEEVLDLQDGDLWQISYRVARISRIARLEPMVRMIEVTSSHTHAPHPAHQRTLGPNLSWRTTQWPIPRLLPCTVKPRQQERGPAGPVGYDRTGCHGHPHADGERPVSSRSTPGSWPPPAASRASPISTATRACCCTAAIRSSSSPRTATSSMSASCSCAASCPMRKEKADFHTTIQRHTMVHEQMARFFQGFRRDAHPMAVLVRRGRSAVGLLSRGDGHLRSAPSRHLGESADREVADHHGDGLQVQPGPAVHVSAQRLELRRELHAHDVRHAVREVRAQSGAGEGARSHPDPARRSRAERLDLDGASGGLLGGQPVCLHLGRHRLPVGAGARGRERGLPQHAGADRRRVAGRASTSRGRRTRATRSS